MSSEKRALRIDCVVPDLKAADYKQAFRSLCGLAAGETGLDTERLFSRLMAWERKNVSFGMGSGVAIPHLALTEIDRPCLIFARLQRLVDYHSVDSQPVDLIFMMLSPESDGPRHLQRLARISRMLRDPALCRALREAGSADALEALLFDGSSHRLAA